MEERKTIVLVLKDGKDFGIRDVELIARHINGRWISDVRPRIICLWDKATTHYDLGNFELIPLTNNYPGTWSRIQLYSPEMDQYRPFLYVDLDTAVIGSIESIFSMITDPSLFITLEDFWQKGQLATGLVWFPNESEKVKKIWNDFKGVSSRRMDNYIRSVIQQSDAFWQNLGNSIYDFKPRREQLLLEVPKAANLICFHGKPRIFDAQIDWVKDYISKEFTNRLQAKYKVTVIIPYNKDRGWLQQAVDSVPKEAQLLLSKGDGNWPQNFNKVLDQAEGQYIRWLHEDDMLTPNCIDDSIKTFEEQDVDFIHGNAIELRASDYTITSPLFLRSTTYRPTIKFPTVEDLLRRNVIHSATLMYKREVFEKLKMDETLNTAEEFEFNLRCLKAGLKIGYCVTSLAFYRRHPQQKVRVVSREVKDKEREQVRSMYR
jgi:hypothetical protein